MEKANSEDGSGGIELRIGFRFQPTDQELILHYLKRKVYSLPLPATVIPELDVFLSNPWDLPGEELLLQQMKEEYYEQIQRRLWVGDWVVCRLYQRKRKARSIETVIQLVNSEKSRNLLDMIRPCDHMNLRMRNNDEKGFSISQESSLSSWSSSCSSGITEISSNDLDQEVNSQIY